MGSYSLDIPLASGASRTVRLILLEYMPGVPMNLLQPTDFSRRIRKKVMKAIVNAESQIYKRDIRLMDLHPRNILVQGLIEHTTPNPQVTFVDFVNVEIGHSWKPNDPTVEASFAFRTGCIYSFHDIWMGGAARATRAHFFHPAGDQSGQLSLKHGTTDRGCYNRL